MNIYATKREISRRKKSFKHMDLRFLSKKIDIEVT